MEFLKQNIENKATIIEQSLNGLTGITFDPVKGLIAEQIESSLLASSMNNSQVSDSAMLSSGTDYHPGRDTDDLKKLRLRNKREIESLEKQTKSDAAKGSAAQRMCGCEAFCSVF